MDLSTRMTGSKLREFVDFIEGVSQEIGFKISSRGWGYILEQRGMIDKSQFDKVEGVINRCRREGLLPVDFVAEEAARAFSNVEEPTTASHAAGSLRHDGHRSPGVLQPRPREASGGG